VLTKLTIAQKFTLLSVTFSILMVIMTTSNSLRLNTMAHHISAIETADIPLTKGMTSITEHQLEQEIYFERAFRFAFEMKTEAHAKEEIEHAIEQFQHYAHLVDKEIKDNEQLVLKQIKVVDDESTKQELNHLLHELKLIEEQHATWSKHAEEVLTALTENKIHHAVELSIPVEEEAQELEKHVVQTLERIEKFTESAIIKLDQEDHQILLDGIIYTIIGILIAAAFSFYNIKLLNKDMGKLTYSINELNKGELINSFKSQNISKDLGFVLDNIESLREKLKATLQLIHSGSSETVSATTNLNNLTSEVLGNIEQQSSEVDMLATAMEEMGATSSEIANNAETTQASTVNVTNFSSTCQNEMGQAISAMTQLSSSLDNSAQNITALEEHGQKIGSVLDVIKSIADQTNLLALNAAIEAARAGEQGRGFAVVADEVRTLAQRTQESTTEIEAMIMAFKAETTDAVKAMDDSQGYAETMLNTAQKSNENLTEISSAIGDVNGMTIQIASAAEEQAATVQEINQNLNSVSDISRQNLDSSTQVSTASEQIETISKQVLDEISYFKFS